MRNETRFRTYLIVFFIFFFSLAVKEIHDPSYVPAKGWAGVIRKVYEVDPLICPSCGGQMRIISFIDEPKTIDRIIRHLELPFEAERPPPPHHLQQHLLMAAEESGEYF